MRTFLRLNFFLPAFLFFMSYPGKAQDGDTTLYLITCGPGTEIYSIYGHSALLAKIGRKDTIYNWGVFDFDTPNFAWKFAKGKLEYMLATEPLRRFLSGYFYENRYVIAQKINLTPAERKTVFELVNENLKPENVRYRYDFFYDDCSTRIRDLLEKSIGKSLKYPEQEEKMPTFRDLIGEYQQYYPWLQFGVDLLIGSNAEKKADIREKMFLPDYLMSGLSSAVIDRDGTSLPLLEKKEVLLDFEAPARSRNFYTSPFFVFAIVLVLITFLSLQVKSKAHNNVMDFILFFIFFILSVMMIFFNFFTDHKQLTANYNILWLNPFIIILFFAILTNRNDRLWSRIVFFITLLFLLGHLFIPQAFNVANYPIMLILLLRTMARSGFSWSPVKA